jgi:EAL domain-containing protein (putative c-di-GMP-specific phosphodiesterase class I)
MGRIRGRTGALVAIATAGLLVVVFAFALVLTRSADGFAEQSADQRARLGVDLLVTVGSRLPTLNPSKLSDGVDEADRRALDQAVATGRRQRVLAGLMIWDRSGRVVYSGDERLEGTRPAMELDLRQALTGVNVVRRHPTELDPISGRHTGVLDAFEALRDDHGRVFGAIETSLPLAPIVADAARIRSRILTALLAAAAILWIALMPLTIRAARGFAKQWDPERRRLLRAFGRGLQRGEIELVYQPQLDPQDGTVKAVEALVRWRRGDRLQPPGAFLDTIESSPLITPLTDRVIELALRQLSEWKRAGHVLRMSVNLSAANLVDESLPARIAAIMTRHCIAGSELTVEVTETAILEDPACAQRVVTAITDLGVEVAVDDFGTGHASIARLHQLPIREVKVDRTFVMRTDDRSRDYLAAIVQFGRSLGMRVVAEGVEDEQTLQFLRGLDCDLVQGYHLSRPLDPVALVAWLHQNAADAHVDGHPLAPVS